MRGQAPSFCTANRGPYMKFAPLPLMPPLTDRHKCTMVHGTMQDNRGQAPSFTPLLGKHNGVWAKVCLHWCVLFAHRHSRGGGQGWGNRGQTEWAKVPMTSSHELRTTSPTTTMLCSAAMLCTTNNIYKTWRLSCLPFHSILILPLIHPAIVYQSAF